MLARIHSLVRRPRSGESKHPQRASTTSALSSTTLGTVGRAASNPQFAGIARGFLFTSATHCITGTRHRMEDFNVSVAVDDSTALFAVCDGHGGSKCAAFVAEALPGLVREEYRNLGRANWGTALATALVRCGEQWDNNPAALGGCGCVVTAMLINGLDYVVAQVGDCGLAASTNTAEVATMITVPHHVESPSETRRVIEAGGQIFDGRLLGVLKPSRAFGDLDVRAMPGGSSLISEPEVSYGSVEFDRSGNGFLILASDGVWDVFNAEDAGKTVKLALESSNTAREAAKVLAIKAARSNVDDISCTVVHFTLDNPGS